MSGRRWPTGRSAPATRSSCTTGRGLATTWRRTAFVDAVVDGQAELAGVRTVRVNDPEAVRSVIAAGAAVPVAPHG
jgi:hypothetical protein